MEMIAMLGGLGSTGRKNSGLGISKQAYEYGSGKLVTVQSQQPTFQVFQQGSAPSPQDQQAAREQKALAASDQELLFEFQKMTPADFSALLSAVQTGQPTVLSNGFFVTPAIIARIANLVPLEKARRDALPDGDPMKLSSGMSSNTMLLIGAAAVALILILRR
jgi:hypothetical protein